MSRHNEDYPSKTLVKNITPLPRTISEANRDAMYACAIQTFKSDAKLTLEFIGQAFIGGIYVLCAVGAVAGLVYWLTKG